MRFQSGVSLKLPLSVGSETGFLGRELKSKGFSGTDLDVANPETTFPFGFCCIMLG